MQTRLMADLNHAVLSRDSVRAQVLRKALAACRMECQSRGLPPHADLGTGEAYRVLKGMVQSWEEEARRLEREGHPEQADLCRVEISVLTPYLWLASPETEPGEETAEEARLQRHHHRLNVGPEFTVKFYVMDEAFEDVQVLNFGAGGCCVQLDPELAELLQKGSCLHNLTFCHPDLPNTPVLAEVVYLMGKFAQHRNAPAREGRILAGLKFVHPPAAFQETLAHYVLEGLREEGVFIWPGFKERIPRWGTGVDANWLCTDLGPEYTASFFLLDEAFTEVPILNLGAGGCCLQLHPELAELLKSGIRLHNFALCHPDLPEEPQHAEVVYVAERPGRGAPDSGTILRVAGIHFIHPKADYQAELSRFVRKRLRSALL